MRREVSIVGGYGKDADRQFSAEDTLNWLPVRAESPGARSQFMLRQPPGVKPLAEVDGGGPIRGLHTVEGRMYVVSGTTLYELSNALVFIPRGTVPGVDRVSMAHNQRGYGNELAVDNGAARYVLNTATLVFGKVTDEGFPGSFMAFYVDQYLGYVEPQGRYWGHSELADALNYSTIDQYEAEGDPDRIVSAYVSHREVLIFGKETIEPFVNTGGGTGTFERASNTVVENGCASRYGVAGMDNSVFWPDDKRIIRRMEGYTAVRISTAAEEALLATCTDSEMKRAYAFTWEDRGHKVYYLTVPGKFTLGYDLLSGLFHRRSSPGMNTWRINSLAYWNGMWVGGDMHTGKLYSLDWDYCYDGADELVRERVTGALSESQARILVSEIELLFSTGGPAPGPAVFEAQPTGPSITGDAPNGSIGVAYSYAYSTSGGTAPLVVALAPGSAALPAGLTLSSAGVLSGSPTTAASYSWVVRVTDANGLYDDLADSTIILEGFALITDVRAYDGAPSALAVAGADIGWDSTVDIVAATPGGEYAVGARHNAGSGFEFRKYDSGTGLWSVLSVPASAATTLIAHAAWSDDGLSLAVCRLTNGSDRLSVYSRSGDTLTDITPPTFADNVQVSFVVWKGARLYGTYGSSAANGQFWYSDLSGGALSALTRFGGPPGGAGNFVALNTAGDLAVVCGTPTATTPYIEVYDVSGTPAQLASYTHLGAFSGEIRAVFWTDDEAGIVAIGSTTPTYVRVLDYDGTPGSESITLVGAAADQPPGAVPARVSAVSQTASLAYIALACTQDYPCVYESPSVAGISLLASPPTSGAAVASVCWTTA